VETRSEGHGALVRIDLDIAKGIVVVSRDDDVHGLDGTKEGLVEIFFGHLELEKSAINLVDDDDGLDTLAKCLPEYGLGLDTDTLDAVYDYEGPVCHTKGSGDF
jgi:hypothetical protein